eukprot:INCI16256.2.p1 GENE.INCI16256.2~~INCI16256.2.p1  ORF type:complete len:353 (+),score=54.69 INCI16256.2:573-1631(+)
MGRSVTTICFPIWVGIFLVITALVPLVSALQLGYKSDAIELAMQGQEVQAQSMFRRHTREFPDDSSGWNNLGVSVMRAALNVPGDKGQTLLLEAAELFRRSLALRYVSSTTENYDFVRSHLSSAHQVEISELKQTPLALKYSTEFCDPNKRGCIWDPMQYTTEQVVQKLDATCEHVAFRISKNERKSGLLDLETLLSAREKIRTCGLAIFERLFSKATILKLRAAQEQHFAKYKADIEKNTKAVNSTGSAQRSPMRFEVKFDSMEHPEFADVSLVRNPLLYTFVKSFLGTGALEVDTHSSVTSLPGAPNQHWHHDTGNLFDAETWPNQNQHSPPHGRSEALFLSTWPVSTTF